MSSEWRLQSLEARLDQILVFNLELRESVDQLESRVKLNRVELLTLRNLVERS